MSEALLKILGGIVVAIIAVFLGGWALTTLWSWFIVPVFKLPELGYVQAIGIRAVITYTTFHHVHTGVTEKFGEACGRALLYPPLVVGIGWIVTKFL